MQEKIKSILSVYLKMDASAITGNTVIDRQALKNSIVVHRLYAALANEGINVPDYMGIKTYGDLLNRLNNEPVTYDDKIEAITNGHNNGSIGIDMELVNNLPDCEDFREDAFYKQNFSAREISYCLLQPEPKNSFAGLFAAKEALIKADNNFKNIPFNQLEIRHDANGKPFFENAELSVTHIDNYAVAVVKKMTDKDEQQINNLALQISQLNRQLNSLQKEFNWWRIFSILLFVVVLVLAVYSFL